MSPIYHLNQPLKASQTAKARAAADPVAEDHEQQTRAGAASSRLDSGSRYEFSPGSATPAINRTNILRLQRTVGNQAVLRILAQQHTPGRVVQRMPTSAALVQDAGKAKKNVLGYNMSVKYKNVMDALDNYHAYVGSTNVAQRRDAILAQLETIKNLLKAISGATALYLNAHNTKKNQKGGKFQTIRQIHFQAPTESAFYSTRANALARTPPRFNPPLWSSIIPKDLGNTVLNLDDTGNTDNIEANAAQGGQNSVDLVTLKGGYKGFFKGSQKFDKLTEQEAKSGASGRDAYAKDATVASMLVGQGIDYRDPRLAERNLAMYRLDQLLQAGVIAKAELAVKEGQFGSLMKKAEGKDIYKWGDKGKVVATEADKKPGEDKMSLEDPALLRMLSRLQLIDAIAGQTDRHLGNYFIEKDPNGKVIAVTGIDNDNAFGKNLTNLNRYDKFPGLSKYVDERLAATIIALDPADLRHALFGLLLPDEIDQTVRRFNALKVYLTDLRDRGKLLKPNDWEDARKARKILGEKDGSNTPKSYASNLMENSDIFL
jgi:hypothetical protein